MKKGLIAGIAALVVVAIGLTFYFWGDSPTHTGNGNKELDRVSVRMKWFFAGTMTGWFAGKDQDIFARHGIDLTINSGGPDNSSVKLVAAGSDQFGVAGADEVLLARAKGVPVVAIGVLFKESPICFISKRTKSIRTPEDWAGKTVEVSYGSNAEVQYQALVAKYNVKEIKEVPYTFNLVPFIKDKVDVSVAYKMDQVVTLQRKGIDLSIITAKEHGINPYGDVVITTEATLKAQPELVRSFMAAVVESHIWAIQNPVPAVQILVDNTGGNLSAANENEVWRETIPFLTADGGLNGLGHMAIARWKETSAILVKYAQLDPKTDLSKAFVDIVDTK